jgi:hypothetical protein
MERGLQGKARVRGEEWAREVEGAEWEVSAWDWEATASAPIAARRRLTREEYPVPA